MDAFKEVSSIMMPTCANVSFKLNSIQNPVEMYEQDIYTIPANLAGLPAISIPSGIHSNGLPIGVQLVAAYGREDLLIQVGSQLESEIQWSRNRAPIHA